MRRSGGLLHLVDSTSMTGKWALLLRVAHGHMKNVSPSVARSEWSWLVNLEYRPSSSTVCLYESGLE